MKYICVEHINYTYFLNDINHWINILFCVMINKSTYSIWIGNSQYPVVLEILPKISKMIWYCIILNNMVYFIYLLFVLISNLCRICLGWWWLKLKKSRNSSSWFVYVLDSSQDMKEYSAFVNYWICSSYISGFVLVFLFFCLYF